MSVDEMSASSKYPFYVELEHYDDLILGQHIYMELETEEDSSGICISSGFLCYEGDGSVYVWAEKGKKLEKRHVTLGEYNFTQDTVEVVDGLTMNDYIAFPDAQLCREGAPTTRDQVVQETEGEVA
jgi:HlyD family secretion protein